MSSQTRSSTLLQSKIAPFGNQSRVGVGLNFKLRHYRSSASREATWLGEKAGLPAATLLFDHFIGEEQQCQRDRKAERFRGLQIDDEVEPGGLFDRHIRAPSASALASSADKLKTIIP